MKKMSMLLMVLIAIGGPLGYLAAQVFVTPSLPSPVSPQRFPILPRFELPRDYGYFIGDEIPLTLIIETTGGVILDLVNLPQKGETHGPFEIRKLTVTSASLAPGEMVYRIQYILQYFGPTPLTVPFEPLEILYALPRDVGTPASTPTYQSVFTQPVLISIARIGPYHPSQALGIKGPVDDSRSWLIQMPFVLGVALLVVSLGGWSWEYWKKRQWRDSSGWRSPTATNTALHMLQNEEIHFFRLMEEPLLSVGVRLDQILRQYLQTEYQVPAFTLTTAELAAYLNEKPLSQEILCLLERCDTLKYSSPSTSAAEERELWWDTTMLFKKLHEVQSA